MKQVLVFFLISCIASQAFVRTAWALHYQWNRAVYLKNCENRDKSDLHCDGKCYLKKQMAASENSNPKEPQLPTGFHQIKDIQLYFESVDLFPHFHAIPARLTLLPPFGQLFPNDVPLAGVFKPPTA